MSPQSLSQRLGPLLFYNVQAAALACALYFAVRAQLLTRFIEKARCHCRGCAKVLGSPLSHISGIPIASIGLATVFALLLATLAIKTSHGLRFIQMGLLFTFTGALILQVYSAMILQALCLYCWLFFLSVGGALLASIMRRDNTGQSWSWLLVLPFLLLHTLAVPVGG